MLARSCRNGHLLSDVSAPVPSSHAAPPRLMKPLALLRLFLLFLALVPLAGCGALQTQARGLGGSLVSGATGNLDSDSTRERIHRVSDASLASVASAYQSRLFPVLDTTFLRLSAGAHNFLHGTQDSLTLAIRGPISASFQALLRDNLRTAGQESRAQLALTMAGLDQELQARIVPVLVGAVGASVDTALARAAAGESKLRPMVDSIVTSAVRAGVKTGIETARDAGEPIWRKFVLGGAAVLATLLALVGWWLWRERKQRGEALAAIAEAINHHVESGDGEIKKRIKARAQARQVEGYLLSFLEKEGLRKSAPAGAAQRIPAPPIFDPDRVPSVDE